MQTAKSIVLENDNKATGCVLTSNCLCVKLHSLCTGLFKFNEAKKHIRGKKTVNIEAHISRQEQVAAVRDSDDEQINTVGTFSSKQREFAILNMFRTLYNFECHGTVPSKQAITFWVDM